MGGCISCKVFYDKEKRERQQFRKFMKLTLDLETFNKHQSLKAFQDLKEKKLSIIYESNEKLDLTFFDYELRISDDDTSSYGSSKKICKTITFTSEPGDNESKRRKSTYLTENYESDPSQCSDVRLESNYFTQVSDKHKIPEKSTFISKPLTADDVNEVFNGNTESNSLSHTLSPLSFDSSLVTDVSHSNEFTKLLEDFPNNPCGFDEVSLKGGASQEGKDSSKDNCNNYDLSLPNFQNISNKQILNSVPNAYEAFKKNIELDNYKNLKQSKNKGKPKTREILSISQHYNVYDQNVLHQLVLSGNYTAMENILECLVHMKSFRKYLDHIDWFHNSPFAYAVMGADIEMIKLLLPFQPKIPLICYFKRKDCWMPILHTALEVSLKVGPIESCKENAFLLICKYLTSLNNYDITREVLETKDANGLTILHFMMVRFVPMKETTNIKETDYQFYINYLLKIGSNLKTECSCPLKRHIQVDGLGQILFTKYPVELLELLIKYENIENVNFKWDYVIDNIIYKLEELFMLRTDIDKEDKLKVLDLLRKLN